MTVPDDEWEVSDHSYVDHFLRIRDERVRLHGWRHRPDRIWCYVSPPGVATQVQGWKIHVSATPRSAVQVLTAASRVLLDRRVPFKFACGLRQLRTLLSIRMDRGSGGKFITVYPEGPQQFAELLEALHEATAGLEGPAILSDRRYRPDSLVHYRYGGFSAEQRVLDVDGSYAFMLVSPDGQWTRDERKAWYSPPAWAPAPLPENEPPPSSPGSGSRGPARVKLHDRFVVHEAIRHSNRGGVYRALDELTGRTVVIKEARPFVGAELDGTDARDYLRNEHRTLRGLEPLDIAVRPVAFFEYQKHSFLAEEEVPGVTLRAWVEAVLKSEHTRTMPFERVLPVAKRLVELAAAVHDKGLVFRDFTPNNVMVRPDAELVLIDTEFMAVPGERVTRVQTWSYAAPEETAAGPVRGPAPPQTADLYSIGASLFYLCTGVHPVVPSDGRLEEHAFGGGPPGVGEPRRPYDTRVDFLVRAVSSGHPALRVFAPLVLGLLKERPEQRLTLHQVQELLDGIDPQPSHEAAEPLRLPTADQDRLLTDGWAQLVAGMTPDDQESLWPAPPMEGRIFDTLALQAGSAGALEVIRQAARATGRQRLREVLRTGLEWLDARADRSRRELPGLYFGRAGTYWAMYEAADDLEDAGIQARSLERIKRLPVAWANPDITHGVAGGGLAQLHLWRRTRDDDLRERVLICVDSVMATRAPDGLVWPVPAMMGAAGGLTHYGFAHGVAGICAFLLSVSRELDRPDALASAVAGGDFLLSQARSHGDGVLWPTAQTDDPEPGPADGVCWWCSGAAGIGTFLIRLWRATGDGRYRDAAHRAAVSTRKEKWFLTASHCHGLAGNGEFLLDMAAATGERRYREWAEEYATALYRLCALHQGRLVVPDETNAGMTYSYNLGMSGPIAFLHRLRYGGERWWMVDDFALPGRDER
ncbi:class IV lanthionine synthetase LanL [Streptomyces coffeae]|uniref:Class IV lanthionine synthetase LanL n=1 Tax=Streptomyces coffeae TaxID=621382 RepID=A0ABS1NLS4_9ACTN|nr:class IV lanthionine synthetase LanL [Streptomyces coffeae]MBL1101057.1 class IV lanthionine synthetase LanL [Streptomyces coffeae]